MLNRFISIGITKDLKRSLKFKIRVMNSVAIGTMVVLALYTIIHEINQDSRIYLMSHIFYIATSFGILRFNYLKKYGAADYIMNILFPISFVVTSIAIGDAMDVEYFLYVTAVSTNFMTFFTSRERKFFFVYNLFLFIITKINLIVNPNGLIGIDKEIGPYLNVFNGITVLVILYVIVLVVMRQNRSLVLKLKQLTSNQERIIEERTIEIKKKTEDLERYVHELERFAYISSHDLREPLRNIMSFSQLLNRDINKGNTQNLKEYLAFINKGVARMDNLTKDIVSYAGIEKQINETSDVDINLIIQNIAQDFDKQVVVKIPEPLPILHINKNLCHILFFNIIENAIQYSKNNHSKITIKTKRLEDYYEFSIRDNGIGIEEKYLEIIFEMFKRLHNDLENKGSGIGLAICKKIVAAYNGKIWAESKLKEGSTFYFTLPLA